MIKYKRFKNDNKISSVMGHYEKLVDWSQQQQL